MYLTKNTVATCTDEQLLSPTLTRLRSPYLPFGLLLGVVDVFGSETGAYVASAAFLLEIERVLLVL